MNPLGSQHTLHTLIINPWTGRPHAVIPWQRAICLLFAEEKGKPASKIDVLETYDVTASSPSITVEIPCVAQLRRGVNPVKKGVKFSQSNVFARDDYRCCYCNEQFDAKDLNYDHVRPKSKGGQTDWDNIVTSCYPHNRKKGNRTAEQVGMKMHFKPYRPTVLPIAVPIVSLRDIPEKWKPWLPDFNDLRAVG